ncbi:MAG: hypothetical protein BHV88_13040 [Clostridiales bacterium 41_12_two_minus]|nr:MAG: hypothetical protein BHV88_13040 [Clostridiales bacterium 41_12_two_minus]
MKTLNNNQKEFFQTLSEIQETVVAIAMCKTEDEKEKLLYDVTYDTIYSILEFLDGCTKDKLSYRITKKGDNDVINEEIQLHGVCPYYIKNEVYMKK